MGAQLMSSMCEPEDERREQVVTNTSELGMWMETYNPVYGLTRNPYALGRTAGGSSGGEAALIAAGGSPMGLGSDVGGSLRIPAAFCGVFSHKPSVCLARALILPVAVHPYARAKRLQHTHTPLVHRQAAHRVGRTSSGSTDRH